ncbi:MAG: lactonase family protein [Dehalococcoidia bacterium]|nr:lactonase family protein [Dehalococcoidia bacterium]
MTQTTGTALVFIGTYTHTDSQGVYTCRFDRDSGALEQVSVATGAGNPSFVALHPSKRYLYAASEVMEFDGKEQGAVYAYSIDAGPGELNYLNSQGAGGPGPCHVKVDATGRFVLAANYHGGSVCMLPIEDDGSLAPASDFIQHEGSSVNPRRQDQAHTHSINPDAQNRFAYVPDLGQDRVVIYRLDTDDGRLIPNEPACVEVNPGFGPRHFDFHPGGKWAYLINELGSMITVFEYDRESGSLSEFQVIGTLPTGFSGSNTTADIHVHPSGRFVYGSNRGHDSIAIFAVDEDSGRLTALGHRSTRGRTPRNFGIDPSGRFLIAANQDSDSIVSFHIDQDTGQLTPTGHELNIPMPVCIRFLDE